MGLFKVAALGLIFPVLPAWLCCISWHSLFARFSERRCLGFALFPWVVIAGLLLLKRILPSYSDQVGQVVSAPLGIGYWLAQRTDSAGGLGEFLALYTVCALFSFPLAAIFGAPLWLLICAWSWPPSDSHGTAAWETAGEAKRAGSLLRKGWEGGIMMGRLCRATPWGVDGRYRTWRHVLTCAPTGAGKGIGCVIPNLLHYPGSVLCLDVKGENYAVTARARGQRGQKVVCLDPFDVTGRASDAFNWLAEIDLADPESFSDAASLADALVMRSHGHADAHWDDAAAHLLQGLILYVASLAPKDRHSGTLRALVAQPEKDLLRLCQKLSIETALAHGLVARAANAFLGKADRERSGVLSTVTRHTHFLDDPRLIQVSRASSFSFADLKTRAVTIYVVLPPDKLKTHARFARLVFGQAIRAMTRILGRPRHPVLFLVDEFAQLGYFSAIEDAISILRGYGVTLWLLVQDLSQLQAIYPRWRSFLANTILQAFGSQDHATTEHLSRLLGHKTITVVSKSKSKHNSTTAHSQARALMTPDEVRRLGPHRVMVFEQGRPAQMLQRLNYLSDRESRRCFDDNPMHTPPLG